MSDLKKTIAKKGWRAWYKELTDSDQMPFGMHQGKKMEEVPDKYLLGLYEKLKNDVSIYPDSMADRVRNYIAENLDVITKNAESVNCK